MVSSVMIENSRKATTAGRKESRRKRRDDRGESKHQGQEDREKEEARRTEKLLEIGDGSDTRVGVVGMGRVADGCEVASHQAEGGRARQVRFSASKKGEQSLLDEHAVVGDLEKLLAVNLEDG